MIPITAFACASVPSDVAAGTDTCLRIGFLGKVDSLNPTIGITDAARVVRGLVYDCLTGVGPDLEPVPNLATSWEIAEGFDPPGSVWDYHITSNARWHDGTRVTVDDVVFTLNMFCSNYNLYYGGFTCAYFINRSSIVDDHTVRVHFSDRGTGEPMVAAFAASIDIPILPKHLVEGMTYSQIAFDWLGIFDNSTPPLVGSGPFMATDSVKFDWMTGNTITLVRNPDYHWKADRDLQVRFDRLEIHNFDNGSAMRTALERGEIDFAQLPRDDYLDVEEKVRDGLLTDLEAHAGPRPDRGALCVMVNLKNAGMNPSRLDPVIRQAMAMATNRTAIVSDCYDGLATEGTTLIPSVNREWHCVLTDDETVHYDIDAANALLESNGYTYSQASPTVRVCTADSYAVQGGLVAEGTPLVYDMALRQECPEEYDIAKYLQSEWAEIGIDVNYRIITELVLGVISWQWDTMFWDSHSGPDPNNRLFAQSERAVPGMNINGYHDLDYEDRYNMSISTLDPDLRKEHVHECQRVHYEDMAYIPLAEVHGTYAWRTDNFTGWGDWDAQPGRSIYACWSGNILYFELDPVEGGDISPLLILAGVTFAAAAAAPAVAIHTKRRGGSGDTEP
jgi:peptide/nickel transport system substrate-binding protein